MKYILGDVHVRKEQPFFSAAVNLFEYLKKSILKPGDSLYQLGDIFHNSKPSPLEYALVINFLHWCKNNNIKVFIMRGNHDYNANQNTFSTDPLVELCTIYNQPFTTVSFSQYDFVFLPWLSSNQIKSYIGKNMSLNEFYSEVLPETDIVKNFLKESKKTFLFYHFPDETLSFGENFEGIDLSLYEKYSNSLTRIGGDIHVQRKNYIGTPYQTRYDEKDQIGKIYQILDNGHISILDLPLFLSYKDIKFGEEIKDDPEKVILTISEAPSVSAANEAYKEFFIRKVTSLTDIERVIDEEENIESNIINLLDNFLTINSVDKKTSNYLKGLMI